jgi:hypothetical protein
MTRDGGEGEVSREMSRRFCLERHVCRIISTLERDDSSYTSGMQPDRSAMRVSSLKNIVFNINPIARVLISRSVSHPLLYISAAFNIGESSLTKILSFQQGIDRGISSVCVLLVHSIQARTFRIFDE